MWVCLQNSRKVEQLMVTATSNMYWCGNMIKVSINYSDFSVKLLEQVCGADYMAVIYLCKHLIWAYGILNVG